MPHVDILYNQIQARGIDASKALNAVQSFKTNIQSTRNASSKLNVPEKANTNRLRYNEERSVAAKKICNVIPLQCEGRSSLQGIWKLVCCFTKIVFINIRGYSHRLFLKTLFFTTECLINANWKVN